MVKLRIEICIISAHDLGHSSSLWKPQWFAVGWIDPNNKYCTKIDSSGIPNPTWKTRFSVPIDHASTDLEEMSISIEVYRREPIFLREKLQGIATIMLKEFFDKLKRDEASVEEAGSFQLRKRNSGKPKGFVDISVRIFEERPDISSYSGGFHDGFSNPKNEISVPIEDGQFISYPAQPQPSPFSWIGSYTDNQTGFPHPYSRPRSPPGNYMNPAGLCEESFRRPATPPPPPPPSNTGFLSSPFTGATASRLPENYINMPAARSSDHKSGPGFETGLGAGVLAAGAMIFGDDFLSTSSLPAGLEGGALAVSTDPPF